MFKSKFKKLLILLLCFLCGFGIFNMAKQDDKKVDAVSKSDVKCIGVDISKWQGTVNFDTLKSKASFVILRIGYGTSLDSKFESYLNSVLSKNIPFGVYIYSIASNVSEAQNEANWVVSKLNNYGLSKGKLTYPVFFDYEMTENDDETPVDQRPVATNTSIINAFMDTVRAGGYYPALYCGGAHVRYGHIKASAINADFWIAAYGISFTTFTNNYYSKADGKCVMWQYNTGEYTDATGDVYKGSYYGVSSSGIDQNFCFIDYPSKIKASGLNGFSGSSSGGNTNTDTSATLSAEPSSFYKYVGNVEYINGVGPNNDSTAYTNLIGNRDLSYSASWTAEQKKAGIKPAILDGTNLTTKSNKLSISGWAFVNGGQEKVVWSTDKYNWYDCTGGSYSSADSTLTDYVVNQGYISSGQAMASKAVFDNISADLSKNQNKTITIHFAVIAGLDSSAPMHFLTINNFTVSDTQTTPSQPTDSNAILSADPSSYYKYVGNIQYINGVGPNNSTTPYENVTGNRDLNYSASWTPEQKKAGIKPAILDGAKLSTKSNKLSISGCAFVNGGQSKIVWSIDKYNWYDCTGGSYSSADSTLINYVVNQGYISSGQAMASKAVFDNISADLSKYQNKTITLYFAVISDLDPNAPMHFLTINNLKVSEQVQEETPNSSSSETSSSISSSETSSSVSSSKTSSSVSSSTQENILTSSVIPPQTSVGNNEQTTSQIVNSKRPEKVENGGCGGNITSIIYLIPLALFPLVLLNYKKRKD